MSATTRQQLSEQQCIREFKNKLFLQAYRNGDEMTPEEEERGHQLQLAWIKKNKKQGERYLQTADEERCWATPTWICKECSPSPTMNRPCPPSARPEYSATVSCTLQRPKTAIAIYVAHKLTSTAFLHLLLFNKQKLFDSGWCLWGGEGYTESNECTCHRPWLIGGKHLLLKLAIRWSANRRCELARVGTPPISSDLLQRKKQLLDSSTWLKMTTYCTRFPRGTNRHLSQLDILHMKRYHTRNQWEYTNAHE